MILAISIAVALAGWFISYHVLFTGWTDFCEGADKFFHLNEDANCRTWEYTEGQSATSKFRFFMFVLAPLTAAVLTYFKLYINSH
jgi:hypothetical protein